MAAGIAPMPQASNRCWSSTLLYATNSARPSAWPSWWMILPTASASPATGSLPVATHHRGDPGSHHRTQSRCRQTDQSSHQHGRGRAEHFDQYRGSWQAELEFTTLKFQPSPDTIEEETVVESIGLHLVGTYVDDMRYRRQDGRQSPEIEEEDKHLTPAGINAGRRRLNQTTRVRSVRRNVFPVVAQTPPVGR